MKFYKKLSFWIICGVVSVCAIATVLGLSIGLTHNKLDSSNSTGVDYSNTDTSQSVKDRQTDLPIEKTALNVPMYYEYNSLSQNFNNVFSNNGQTSDSSHSWVFVGGADMNGNFVQKQVARNYINQFQEGIRGIWNIPSQYKQIKYNYYQKYVINKTSSDYDLNTIVTNWNNIKSINAQTVCYMVGSEDFNGPNSSDKTKLDAYVNNLVTLIKDALALRNNNGFIVLQTHYKTNDANLNQKIEQYNGLINLAIYQINTKNSELLKRILVVDHYSNTDNQAFLKSDLNADQSLNQSGHYTIANQLWSATFAFFGPKNASFGGSGITLEDLNQPMTGYTFNINDSNSFYLNKTDVKVSALISNTLPNVVCSTDSNNSSYFSLKATIPADVVTQGYKTFYYQLFINKKIISANVSIDNTNTFTISNLEGNQSYTLKIFTSDGKQLKTVYGTTSNSNVGTKKVLNEAQTKFQQKINSKDKLTWMMVGDSISQGWGYTKGYNCNFENIQDFIINDQNRKNDTFINLAVAGSTASEENLNYNSRIGLYEPADIMFISLGVNDVAAKFSAEQFQDNITKIISNARSKNPNVYIIISSILPTTIRTVTPNIALFNQYNEILKNLSASLSTTQSYIYFNDLYTKYNALVTNFNYFYNNGYTNFYATDGLHLGVNAHLFMTNFFIDVLGYDKNDSVYNWFSYINVPISNLSNVYYDAEFTTNKLTLDLSSIKQSSYDIRNLVLYLTYKPNNQTYSITIDLDSLNNTSYELALPGFKAEDLDIQLIGYSTKNPNAYQFNVNKKTESAIIN
ncbi:MAG: SGNH/GDSL hydrolase family protein [Malacoplasma sp.]|nr:SGNH/GDSL hydrolase family protein [Malacoplasma sp.]